MKDRFTRLASSDTLACLLGRIAFVIWCAMTVNVATAQGRFISAQAIAQIDALLNEKAGRTPAQRKVSSDLLFALHRMRRHPILDLVPDMRDEIQRRQDGKTLVDIRAQVTDKVITEIEVLGGEVISSFRQFDAIRAWMPLEQVEALAGMPEVRFIRSYERFVVHKNDTSEGDIAHQADLARSTFGVDGTGVKIGVLSDSVEALANLQASGDLPNNVTVLPSQAGSGTSEGTAMLEIVYDLAPGAELFFATAFAGQASFAQNILDLNAAGCQVIVDDVSYFAESVFQDGTVAQAVNTVTASDPANGGSLYFSSAGNSGNLNDNTSGVWEGDFSPITAPPVVGGTAHDFGGGSNFNTISTDTPYAFTLQWADPAGASSNDYDLFLLSSNLKRIIASSTNSQTGTQDPFEQIDSRSRDDAGRFLVVVLNSGEGRYLHLNANRGKLSIATNGQTWGHNSAEKAFGVAAVRASGATSAFAGSESVETFSSDGPRRIFYEADGTPITPGDFSSTGGTVRQKPDVAAADGVTTATPGFSPFFGTSAAAPHAAAIAALVLDAGSALTQTEVRDILTSTALDIEATGVDNDSGAGILDAYEAVNTILTAGTVTLVNEDPALTWNYRLTHGVGSLSSWSYTGSNIVNASVDGAAATADWGVESQTATSVIFSTTTPLASGELTGFHITGAAGGSGTWVAGNNSGNVDGALPVALVSFEGISQEDGIQLMWRTASEVNNLGFRVYRQDSNGHLTDIGFVKGAQNSQQIHEYSFLDDDVTPGESYHYSLRYVDIAGQSGNSRTIDVVFRPTTELTYQPTEFRLLPSYPNPFNPEVWIPYELADEATVTIRIYSVEGQLVRELVQGTQKSGSYITKDRAAYWDGRDHLGSPVSSGLYFYQLTTDTFSATRKLAVRK